MTERNPPLDDDRMVLVAPALAALQVFCHAMAALETGEHSGTCPGGARVCFSAPKDIADFIVATADRSDGATWVSRDIGSNWSELMVAAVARSDPEGIRR